MKKKLFSIFNNNNKMKINLILLNKKISKFKLKIYKKIKLKFKIIKFKSNHILKLLIDK